MGVIFVLDQLSIINFLSIVPPSPLQGDSPWLVANKFHVASNPSPVYEIWSLTNFCSLYIEPNSHLNVVILEYDNQR